MVIDFNNTYVKLGEKFYTKISPTPVSNPELIQFNYPLADQLGINLHDSNPKEIAEIFSGNKLLEDSEPIALVYAGHQFGYFMPQLGDGRAILLGEIIDTNGNQCDIQLKGSGPTPYSRGGDGRAALGPIIREYIVSEAMHKLNIMTTRSLAIVTTGENVFRTNILPGAILTRISSSHIRIGTFEYFAAQEDLNSLKKIADYAINRHYPYVKELLNPYQALIISVLKKQICLIVDWMRVGFIHGVMNTDNMAISGETIDYGPCAFMDKYHPEKVFSSIDIHGRYSFNNQAKICLWNILQLHNSLSPLIYFGNEEDNEKYQHALISQFKNFYDSKWLKMMSKKIGIINTEDQTEKDAHHLIFSLLNIMQEDEADYTLTFRYLSYIATGNLWPYEDLFKPSVNLSQWIKEWQISLNSQNASKSEVAKNMFNINPAFIPRNHIIEQVIKSATENNDFNKMHDMLKVLMNPYKEQHNHKKFMSSPSPAECIFQTFCGT